MHASAARLPFPAAVLAAALCAVAAVACGRGVDGYSHAWHPLALLGAAPLPHARGFNAFGFVLPGLLVGWVALEARARLPAGLPAASAWSARLGAQLLLLAALAFAAQGLLPLDASDLEGARSGRHAAAWMAWLLAFVSGGVLLAAGLRGVDRRRHARWRLLAAASLIAACAVPLCALLLPRLVPAGIAQRLALACWFGWAIAAGRAAGAAQP